MHPSPLVCFTVAALSLTLACKDASAPAGPGQLVIAAGNNQSATFGTALPAPLTVRITGTDNRPFAGAIVSWTVTQGVAVAQPATSVSNAAGEATTSLLLGIEPGPVGVTASLAGLTPVVFTATVRYDFPCPSVTTFTFGFTGTFDAADCTLNGYYLDALGLTVPTQRGLSFHLASPSLSQDPWLGFYHGDGTFAAMNDDSLLGTVRRSWLNVIVPAGSYIITPTDFAPAISGTYTLTVYDRAATLAGCDADLGFIGFMDPALHHAGADRSAVWVTRGVAISDSATASDCVDPSGPFYSDRVWMWLDSGATLTVREASTDFDAYLTVFGPNNRRQHPGFRAFNDDSANVATTTNAYLVVEAPASAAYLLDFGTRDTATAGRYQVTIAR